LLAQRAADAGNATAMAVLAELQERAGDLHKAVTLCLRALDAGASSAQFDLARMWGRDGQGGAKGAADALRRSDVLRYGLQPDGTPSPPWHPGT
jgi:TPR repeat protein